jgi:hypothetical protein
VSEFIQLSFLLILTLDRPGAGGASLNAKTIIDLAAAAHCSLGSNVGLQFFKRPPC